jgi:hypothetical protein
MESGGVERRFAMACRICDIRMQMGERMESGFENRFQDPSPEVASNLKLKTSNSSAGRHRGVRG